jgi:hypothetical protein
MASPNGHLAATSNRSSNWETFKVTKVAEGVAFQSIHSRYVYANAAGDVYAKGEEIQAWEKFQVTTNSDGTISLQSAHGKYVYADLEGQLRAAGEQIGAWEKFSVSSCSSCPSMDFAIDYSPDQCSWQNGVSTMACSSKDGYQCGLRVSSHHSYGAGRFSTRIKAAPGPGIASNFYLYTYGRQNAKDKAWNEIDFEILGEHVGTQSSKIWTNAFFGHGIQFPQFIHVPFDASADFHTYTIDITCCSIVWIVDGITYRRYDLNMNEHPGMIGAIQYADLQVLLSLWGQDRASGNWPEIGYLDDNMKTFPLQASFQVTHLPLTNTCKLAPESCSR